MSAAHVMINVRGPYAFKKQIIASSHRSCELRSRSSRAGQVTPFVSTVRPGIHFPSEYPHSVLELLGRTIPSPSARNATARRGFERPLPTACYLPPGAGTLTHAFANSPIRTQRTSMEHVCWIVAQRRVSCRWPTPQRKAEKMPAARIQEMTALPEIEIANFYTLMAVHSLRLKTRRAPYNSRAQYAVGHAERSSAGTCEPQACRCS